MQNFKLAKEKPCRIRFVEFRKDYSERSKSRNNSKNHQWPSPTRVGIDAPRGEKREKNFKKEKISEKKKTPSRIVFVIYQRSAENVEIERRFKGCRRVGRSVGRSVVSPLRLF